MRFSVLFAFVCLTLALGCNKKVNTVTTTTTTTESSSNSVVKTVAFGETVSLALGETAQVEKTSAGVVFVDVVSDNRCPRNMTCITEGEAFVLVSPGNASVQNKVRIDVDPKQVSRLTITGATIEILGLDPFPEGSPKIKPEDRRLRVRIVKSEKM